jgi:hypothetical protein
MFFYNASEPKRLSIHRSAASGSLGLFLGRTKMKETHEV